MFAGLRPLSFLAPVYLWLLLLPAALLALWMWRVVQRGGDLRRLRESRFTPVPERWSRFGDLLFWLCLVLASAALTVALARPRTVAPGVGRAGLDVIILQDGSASMLVNDMAAGTRWARSMTFLRRFGDALRWEGDRMALTVFARIAAPQVRLTRDPNTVFFFLDHLDQQSPFRLEDDATWDTNVEQGIAWGLRALQKDRELIGPSNNIPTFVLVSDGETWSGEVARAITLLRAADIPLFVVGVGTQAGGRMPAMPVIDEEEPPPAISRLDRQGLRKLAMEGGGQYFEIDRDADRDIANTIINARRRPAALTAADVRLTDVHWPLIVVANGLLVAAAITTRRRAVLWWLLAGGLAALTASAEWIGR